MPANIKMGHFLLYRAKTTNIGEIENILRAAKANLYVAAEDEYHRVNYSH